MYIFMVFVPPFFSEDGLTLQKALIGIPILQYADLGLDIA
jgi:hypothetical protein